MSDLVNSPREEKDSALRGQEKTWLFHQGGP